MNMDKVPGDPQNAANQPDPLREVDAHGGDVKFVSDDPGLLDRLIAFIPQQIKTNWFWIVAYGFNFVYFMFSLVRANQGDDVSFTIPILPGVIFTCIIFIQIYADPIEPIPTGGLDLDSRKKSEEKRSQQRYKWMLFAYSFMLLSLMLTFYPFIKPFHDKSTETLRDRPIAVFIGCSLDSTNKNLSCVKSKTGSEEKKQENEQVAGTWAINIGGYVNKCEEDKNGKVIACQVSDGLLVPLYFIILALMGGSISLTRRLPELQKQVSAEHIATERQPKLTQYEYREYLIFQIVQFISAPFLAILAYYLIEPSNTTNSVALAFTAGFASETILLMIRSIANKITPQTSALLQYGAVVGVITLSDKSTGAGKPAEKVEVSLSESPQIHSITDERGFYMLGNVPVGEHSISIKFTTTVNEKEEERLKKDTIRIERAQAIVKKNVTIE